MFAWLVRRFVKLPCCEDGYPGVSCLDCGGIVNFVEGFYVCLSGHRNTTVEWLV